jgi:hypothetical protein
MTKTITESSASNPVFDECDILVVGGGRGRHSELGLMHRHGAGADNNILLERYRLHGRSSVTVGYFWLFRFSPTWSNLMSAAFRRSG